MFTIKDVPYTAHKHHKWVGKCKYLTKGKTPSVGIKGWTHIPSNSYKAAMNSVAKVSVTPAHKHANQLCENK